MGETLTPLTGGGGGLFVPFVEPPPHADIILMAKSGTANSTARRPGICAGSERESFRLRAAKVSLLGFSVHFATLIAGSLSRARQAQELIGHFSLHAGPNVPTLPGRRFALQSLASTPRLFLF